MSVKAEVKRFLERNKGLLVDSGEPTSAFLEAVKAENIRQLKEQLATDLAPLLARLSHIESQQEIIIGLLKSKLNLDVYEKEIMDLMKKQLEKEF